MGAGPRNGQTFFYRDFYSATSRATLPSFILSFTTCLALSLDCTLVFSFAIPSTVHPFFTVYGMCASLSHVDPPYPLSHARK
jgi:hypothetical protein